MNDNTPPNSEMPNEVSADEHWPESLKLTKVYYSIGEVAEIMGEPTTTIRFWEKEFDILKPQRNGRGDRKFTKADVQNVYRIHYLVKKCGLTLKGAKQRMSNLKMISKKGKADVPNDDIAVKAAVVRQLEELRARLIEIRDNI